MDDHKNDDVEIKQDTENGVVEQKTPKPIDKAKNHEHKNKLMLGRDV